MTEAETLPETQAETVADTTPETLAETEAVVDTDTDTDTQTDVIETPTTPNAVESQADTTQGETDEGCASVVRFGGMALVPLGCGGVWVRKKED